MNSLLSLDIIFEPIGAWPGPETAEPRRSQFKAPWGKTMQLLRHELDCLQAESAVVRAYVKPQQLRIDGGLRSGVNPARPGVVLAFDSLKGHLELPCDAFDSYIDNLRAIGLALEALRAVDRYGVTQRNEQYTGWLALPAPMSPGDEIKTTAQALAFLRKIIGGRVDALPIQQVLRDCQLETHPDRGGDADDFKRLMKCERLLVQEEA